MSHLLISYQDDWADEFDVSGFVVVQANDWNHIVAKMKYIFCSLGSFTYGFGTNEEIEYTKFASWEKKLTIVPIDDANVTPLVELFRKAGAYVPSNYPFLIEYGQFPLPYDLDKYIQETTENE